MLVKMWSKGNTSPLLIGGKTCPITMQFSVSVPQEAGNWSTSISKNILLGIFPKDVSSYQRPLFNYVYCCSTHNSQRVKIAHMSINGPRKKENVACVHSEKLFSHLIKNGRTKDETQGGTTELSVCGEQLIALTIACTVWPGSPFGQHPD